MELGTDFSFIALQKHMTIWVRDFYLDLLFWPHPVRREDREQIELLQLDRDEIRVAEYMVELPSREMLEAKLHEAIRLARGQVERSSES